MLIIFFSQCKISNFIIFLVTHPVGDEHIKFLPDFLINLEFCHVVRLRTQIHSARPYLGRESQFMARHEPIVGSPLVCTYM